MKRFYAYFEEDGTVTSVRRLEASDKYTVEGLIKKAREFNEKAGREAYFLFDADDKLEEVMYFLLGEKGYKTYSDIDDLDNDVNELDNSVRNAYETLYDIQSGMDYLKEQFEKIKGKLTNTEGNG